MAAGERGRPAASSNRSSSDEHGVLGFLWAVPDRNRGDGEEGTHASAQRATPRPRLCDLRHRYAEDAMATAKQDARKVLDGLPEEASLEDI